MDEHTDVGRLKSPPFPAITLQKAIERASQLYTSERDHLVPLSSAARSWSMSPTSSGPIQTVGALKQYGLLADEGNGSTRKVRLTHDAVRIVLDKIPTSYERVSALQRCFMAPKIFAELWEKYGKDLPSDQTVLNQLTLERKLAGLAPFSDTGAIELLGNYRLSMAFAEPKEVQDAPQISDTPSEEIKNMTTIVKPEINDQLHKHKPAMPPRSDVLLSSEERIVFTEEGEPGQRIKLIASGVLDEFMLDALENYIVRQKRRLNRPERSD
jgi:hypothetical protein